MEEIVSSSPNLFAPTTPGKRKREEEVFHTPTTSNSKLENPYIASLATANSKRSRLSYSDTPTSKPTLPSPKETPTPVRFRDAHASLSISNSLSNHDYDLTLEVMDLLQDQDLDEAASTSLRSLLNQHSLKDVGIVKGRDITRLALKDKDSKIAELQQRIRDLETERTMDKAVIKQLKSDMAESGRQRQKNNKAFTQGSYGSRSGNLG